MKRLFTYAATAATLATAALAEEPKDVWQHADAGMGQYEGGYVATDGMSVSYSCTPTTTRLSFNVTGNQATKGYGRLAVDGIVAFEGSVTYTSVGDLTGMEFEATKNGHDWEKDQVNKVIDAIAAGGELTLDLPNLTRFSVQLKNSSGIRSCRI